MAELGSGSGTGYPSALDTYDTSVADDVDDVKADHMNDVNLAVIAIQNELGVDPAGSAATVVARIDSEHKAAGTHSDITADSLVMAGKINENKGSNIASATTTDIGAATGTFVHVTGTTTIAGLGTVQAGTRRIVEFDGALTLTHDATQLDLPGNADITTAAGDTACFVSEGSGNWKCVWYVRASDSPDIMDWTNSGAIDLTSGSPTSVSLLSGVSGVNEIEIHLTDVSTDTANQAPMIQIGDSGGLETSGYNGAGVLTGSSTAKSDNSSGFLLAQETNFDAATVGSFSVTLRHMGSNLWALESNGYTDTVHNLVAIGDKTLSDVLTQLTITTSGGTATFDGGTAYVRYR